MELQRGPPKVQGLQGYVRDLRVISGASVQPNGSVLLVLDVPSLLERAQLNLEPVASSKSSSLAVTRPPSALVVDDSLMVRELQRSMLEPASYSVTTATDGAEALALLNEAPADLLVTDIGDATAGGDLQAAIHAFRQARYLDPDLTIAYFQPGAAFELAGDRREARRALAAAGLSLMRSEAGADSLAREGYRGRDLARAIAVKLTRAEA